MGIAYHVVNCLEPPLTSIKEISTLIPATGFFTVENHGGKIIIILRGSVSMEISPGLQFSLQERDLVILPTPCTQTYRPLQSGAPLQFQTLVISFERKTIFTATAALGNPQPLPIRAALFFREYFAEPCQLVSEDLQNTQHLISEIRREADGELPGKDIRINALLCTFLIDLARVKSGHAPPEVPQRGNRKFLVHKADEFIHKNLNKPLTVGEIAWHLKMSQEHLSRLFKRETGYPLKHYLTELRLNHAKTLLLDSNKTITEIAQACGFSSPASFCRSFCQVLRVTPTQYRKINQGKTTH